MSKHFFTLLVLGLLLCVTAVVGAQDRIIGYVLVEFYDGIAGSLVNDLYTANIFPYEPTEMLWLESFETPTNRGEDYGARVGGYLIPPETGDYTFWIASDDTSELWLSPDETYEAAQIIASVSGWARPHQWSKYPEQESAPVSLVAGQAYYIEADFKEGGSGDNLAVAWAGPGIADGNTITVIDGQYLSPYIYGDDDPLIAEYYKARLPDPVDGGLADSTEPTLSWTPIIYADHYLVYLSMDEDAVANGTVGAETTATNSYTATGLATNTLYHWRIDGVAGNGTVYQGHVWSFTVAAKTALVPSPADGVLFVDPNADLNWTAGLGAVEHHLYFGSNADEVVAGINDADKGILIETSYEPGTLERGVTYYWRVDEFDGAEIHTGSLWQFQVEYDVPLNEDPNLVGWWKMEEGNFSRVVDWSGHGNDGTIEGDPLWVAGEDGMALDFDGSGDRVLTGKVASELGVAGNTPRTVATWMYIRSFNGAAPYEMGSHATAQDYSLTTISDNYWRLQHWNADVDFEMEALNEWIHLTQTYDGSVERIYRNGELVLAFEVELNTTDGTPFTMAQYRSFQLDGMLDDVRLYNKAVTEEDIVQIMRGNLLRAWNPMPSSGADVDIEQVTSLSFNAGDGAVLHDIYYGTSPLGVEEALADANISPAYQGRHTETVWNLPTPVEMGQTYYWRIDEIDPNGLLTKGRVWSFNVLDYLILEDFESYEDVNNPIYLTWLDGYNENTGNGTGSVIGYLNSPFMELDIVHGGVQAVSFKYDNRGLIRAAYSEISRTFDVPQDFTRLGITYLQLSFYGSLNNDPDQLYVALEDASGNVAVLVFAGENALTTESWQDWSIALSDFIGIDLTAVKVLYIGVGDRNNPVEAGSGTLILDDILLTMAQ